MSYCRWSSDQYRSDIYCYGSHEGYTIHVAANRLVSDKPRPENKAATVSMDDPQWVALKIEEMNAMQLWCENAQREAINLEYDGVTIVERTAHECADKLRYLRGLGYYVPQGAIDALDEEATSESAEASKPDDDNDDPLRVVPFRVDDDFERAPDSLGAQWQGVPYPKVVIIEHVHTPSEINRTSDSLEQRARDMLSSMGIEGAQDMSAGELVPLANVLSENAKLRAALSDILSYAEYYCKGVAPYVDAAAHTRHADRLDAARYALGISKQADKVQS